MDQELQGTTRIPQVKTPCPKARQGLPTIDIKEIGAVGFHYNLYKKENEVFVTSLYKINHLIEDAL